MTGAGPASEALLERWDAVMMANYGRPGLALASGSGCRVTDLDGRSYLDLLAGIAVSSVGHAHPAVAAAVAEQAARLIHTSNLYAHEPGVRLAERLVSMLGAPARVLFTNSGAEANEGAFKLARRHARRLDPSGARHELVACEGAFHGRTMGALSLTGQPGKQAPFTPLVPGVRHVPWGDVDALAAAVGPATAAVVLEPTLGEAGVVPPPPGYLAAAREICDASGALLVLDEVQSGIGRTGAWFAHQHPRLAVRPDVVTLAKGLGGGLPIGAVLALGEAADAFAPGDHGSTFAGNPVCCAAAWAVLDIVAPLLGRVEATGRRLADGLAGQPLVTEVQGVGLWRGVALSAPVAPALAAAAADAGILLNAPTPDRLRFAPPLILTDAEADLLPAAWPSLVATVTGDTPTALVASR